MESCSSFNDSACMKITIIPFLQVQIVFQHYVISNLDKYFPRSKEFIPERWLKSCPRDLPVDVTTNHHPFASLPFGYGKRMCLGRRFADLEIQTLVAKVRKTLFSLTCFVN